MSRAWSFCWSCLVLCTVQSLIFVLFDPGGLITLLLQLVCCIAVSIELLLVISGVVYSQLGISLYSLTLEV